MCKLHEPLNYNSKTCPLNLEAIEKRKVKELGSKIKSSKGKVGKLTKASRRAS